MANELVVSHSIGKTVYAIIFSKTTNYIYDVGDAAMEAVGTWNNTRAGACDTALTERGAGYYTANFPTLAADTFRVIYFEQAGASPATTDLKIGEDEIRWTGTDESTTPASGSGKTLSDLRSICYFHGWQNRTTEGIAALDRFINSTLAKLAVLAPWPEYHKRDGRVTLATSDEDYVLTDTSSQILDNIARIGDVSRSDYTKPLDEITMDDWLKLKISVTNTGFPVRYALRKYVSSGLIRMEMLVWPKPTSAENGDYLYFPYWIYPDELTLSTDQTDWPNYRLWLLEDALSIRIAQGKRDTSATILEGRDFMGLVNKAMADSRPSYMPIRVVDNTDKKTAKIGELPITCV